MMPETHAAPPTSLGDVPGWFLGHDQLAFGWILEAQSRTGVIGDLLELGETLTVCDLFEDVNVECARSKLHERRGVRPVGSFGRRSRRECVRLDDAPTARRVSDTRRRRGR